MAKIPHFNSLDEAAEFWETHDFEDYVNDTEPVAITVRIPRRAKTLTIRLELAVYERIAQLAAERGIPLEKLVSAWLKERATIESRRT